MRKVYLEGILGEKFGSEWNLAVNSPAEAIQAIACQRSGFKQFLAEGENVLGYDVLIGDDYIESYQECMLSNPSMEQSYSFVPIIQGSKSSGILMVLGVALIAMTGGFAAIGIQGLGGASAAAAGTVGTTATAATQAMGITTAIGETITFSAAAGATGASMGGILAFQGASYLGMGLLLGGAAMLLAPDVPDGTNAKQAENYLFSGPINTTKQGEPIPLVYGRIITGSKTIMGSLFTTSSDSEITGTGTRKLVGISGFRDDGALHGEGGPARRGWWWDYDDEPGRGGYGAPSDIRLKENIEYIGQTDGLNIYEYNYIWSDDKFRGVMAQDLLDTKPEAVLMSSDGYYLVDYSQLGVELERVHHG